jgi:hypothetical protein
MDDKRVSAFPVKVSTNSAILFSPHPKKKKNVHSTQQSQNYDFIESG